MQPCRSFVRDVAGIVIPTGSIGKSRGKFRVVSRHIYRSISGLNGDVTVETHIVSSEIQRAAGSHIHRTGDSNFRRLSFDVHGSANIVLRSEGIRNHALNRERGSIADGDADTAGRGLGGKHAGHNHIAVDCHRRASEAQVTAVGTAKHHTALTVDHRSILRRIHCTGTDGRPGNFQISRHSDRTTGLQGTNDTCDLNHQSAVDHFIGISGILIHRIQSENRPVRHVEVDVVAVDQTVCSNKTGKGRISIHLVPTLHIVEQQRIGTIERTAVHIDSTADRARNTVRK